MSVYEGLGSVQSDLQRLTGFTASLKEHRIGISSAESALKGALATSPGFEQPWVGRAFSQLFGHAGHHR